MGESKALPSFGQVDLELDLDDDVDGAWEAREEPVPPSTSRVFNVEAKRPTRRNMPSVHEESTRIVHGDPLSALSAAPATSVAVGEDGNTRAWIEIDEEEESAPSVPSVRSGSSSGSSGVATRDGRVAAMRELYAKGDADGALALAETFSHSVPTPEWRDSPDASIVVEFGEQSIDLEDPFGGLIPAEDDEPQSEEAGERSGFATSPPPPSAAAQLTLTERQSIPRVLKSMAELSKLKIDHRAGFLLAHVDGMQTLEEILDVCAMPPAEALDLIANLKEMGVIEFE